MTTLQSYRGVDELLDRIDRVRLRRWTIRLLTGCGAAVALGAGAVFLASLSGYLPGQPPATLRWVLLAVLLALAGCVAGWFTRRVFFQRSNSAQTARFIETALPEVRNDLINSVLLSRDSDQPSGELVGCAIRESLLRTKRVDLARSVSLQPLKKWLAAAGISLIVLTAFATLQPGPFRRGLYAALLPGRFVPAANTIDLLSLSPGDASVFPGQPLSIRLAVRNHDGKDFRAEIIFEGRANALPMLPAGNSGDLSADAGISEFLFKIDAVHEPLKYYIRVRGPDCEARFPAGKPWYRVSLRMVNLERFQVAYTYPPYTGWEKKIVSLKPAAATVQAPAGSTAAIQVKFSESIPKGFVEFRDGRRQAMGRADDGRTFGGKFEITANDGFRMIFTNASGQILAQLPNGRGLDDGYYRIVAVADKPPVVEFLAPNRDLSLPPGAALKLKIKARDEYGLGKLRLWTATEGGPAKQVEAFAPPAPAGRREIITEHEWKLDGYVENDVVVYYATATDNRQGRYLGGPQTATTAKFKVTIRNAAKLRETNARRFDELQRRLLAILALQTRQRVNTQIVRTRPKTLAHVRQLGEEIHAGQKGVHRQLRSLVKNFPFDEQLADIRKACAMLAGNEAAQAVDQAQVLASLAEAAGRNRACLLLGDTQEAIIRALQDMLAIMPALAKKLPDQPAAAATDLTADQRRAKREEFSAELKKFIEEQKKVIAAGERLGKKNLDDFTPEDHKLLKELQSLQDKWEKFLNEAYTDFSKLAQQDFSTPSLLKELLAVKTDVTMAKDALQKQAIEIATAAEESGVENAESLTANLEKWLPDEPDRIKWDMEAPEGQENFEQAELPTELEDLVGDLLEEEEDLFEEMDDLTSKAAGSFDKGAGWDAVDGPISSMNAQGVTGNQLPNTSEVSGRSGEGRTGKSAGEFVEDKAVGKGGRRTPTRLGNEPFQKGQINDVSTDPPGGATGGGKVSGSGEEGLEGPTPKELTRQMTRLAGKQAALRNRAERIQANFKAGDFSGFSMQQAILLMNRVQQDLEKGDYRNALRRRRATIEAIRRTGEMMGDKIEVTQDTTAAMPKYIRDNISDAMKGNLPAEYREILEQYYRRLSEQRK
jgi:hypothetical protein